MTSPAVIAARMPAFGASPQAQVRQTTCRSAIVDAWGVQPGERVLEVGCGQGDTTAVLLDRVGPDGLVVAIDPADPDYGAPVTVAQSLAGLAAGPGGERLEFHLQTPLADLGRVTRYDSFDRIVLAHCLFYFPSEAEVASVLGLATRWAPRLGLSEWDVDAAAQAPMHRAAMVLQALAWTVGRPLPYANVQTVASPARLTTLLAEAGWEIQTQACIDTRDLDDGGWELDAVTGLVPDALLELVARPPETVDLTDRRSLPSWCVQAVRR